MRTEYLTHMVLADPDSVEIQFGPNIKDWPAMVALTDNIVT